MPISYVPWWRTHLTLDSRDPALHPQSTSITVSYIVLHPIPLETLLKTICGCLKPGSHTAPTDFEKFGPVARKLDPESKTAGAERHGIMTMEMECVSKESGPEEGFKMDKAAEEVVEAIMMGFPFLICVGVQR